MNVRVRQETEYRGDDWWIWSVWLDGPPTKLDAISYVEYTLHPTFPNPVRRVRARRSGFKLSSAGWGEFEILLKIVPKKGRPRLRTHWLELRETSRPRHKKKGGPAPSVTGLGAPAAEQQPTAFVSSGAADAEAARQLREQLHALGFEIRSPTTGSGATPRSVSIGAAIEAADAAVFLLSDHPSLWLQDEIEQAKALGRPIVPVLVGKGTELPRSFGETPAVRMTSGDQIDRVARSIAEELRGLLPRGSEDEVV